MDTATFPACDAPSAQSSEIAQKVKALMSRYLPVPRLRMNDKVSYCDHKSVRHNTALLLQFVSLAYEDRPEVVQSFERAAVVLDGLLALIEVEESYPGENKLPYLQGAVLAVQEHMFYEIEYGDAIDEEAYAAWADGLELADNLQAALEKLPAQKADACRAGLIQSVPAASA